MADQVELETRITWLERELAEEKRAHQEAEAELLSLKADTSRNRDAINELVERIQDLERPIHLLIKCPECGARHYDEGEFAFKPHHTHSCQSCGWTWRPAVVNTVGVRFLPGFKNP